MRLPLAVVPEHLHVDVTELTKGGEAIPHGLDRQSDERGLLPFGDRNVPLAIDKAHKAPARIATRGCGVEQPGQDRGGWFGAVTVRNQVPRSPVVVVGGGAGASLFVPLHLAQSVLE